jgi:alkaline phosphatase D
LSKRSQDDDGDGSLSRRRFLEMAGAFETEFVCIPRPLERSERADGGPLRYRVRHRAALWGKGERPRLEQQVVEGDPELS